MPRVNSSAIAFVGNDVRTQQLFVTFRSGNTYAYERVPKAVYDGLMRSPSKGEFFNRAIKDRYDYRLIRARRGLR
jgi:hypothetical protein